MNYSKVAVIGAAGHVGLGLTLSIADAGHQVYGIDINDRAVDEISSGRVPFTEAGAEEVLVRVLHNHNLKMTTELAVVSQCDVIVVILGTPIDENLNPTLSPLLGICQQLVPHLHRGQLLILRSTLSPGSTETIRRIVERGTGFSVGEDISLVFAPERVVQGKSLIETRSLPQLIGAFEDRSYECAELFFSTFVMNKCLRLTPVEAELAKLMCNMARYVSFALANEFFLIADEYQANIHRIMDACSYDYPRFRVPSPGANVSGPCLFKDGFFLVERFPFADLISTSFKINESMPVQILKKIRARPSINKVGILGLTFKSGSDDTRYSLSFKLKKLLLRGGYSVVCVDPYVPGHTDIQVLRGCDCVVLMTPHAEFADLAAILECVGNEDCMFVDLWGFWQEMRGRSSDVQFLAKEALVVSELRDMNHLTASRS
jgi:UDP-N-acetyl-D-mannosaminuronic acid dehydrogenase